MQFVEFTAARADTGQTLPYAKCSVYLAGTATLAALFDQTGASIANPLTADNAGRIGFAAVNGTYDLQITSADGVYWAPKIIQFQLFDLQAVANALAAGTVAGLVSKVKNTLASLNADLAAADSTLGLVYADPTPSNNDLYVKLGASGSGSWQGPLGFGVSSVSAVLARIKTDTPAGWGVEISDSLGRIPGGATDQGVWQFEVMRAVKSFLIGTDGSGFSASVPGAVATVADSAGNIPFFVDELGVAHAGSVATPILNGTSTGTIAALFGECPLNLGTATRYVAGTYGQSLANGVGSSSSPSANDGPTVVTTDQVYGNLMFSGGMRPFEVGSGLTSLVPHIEGLTGTGGAGETILGGFQAMLFQMLNDCGLPVLNVPFRTISYAAGLDGSAIAALGSGSGPFINFATTAPTAAKTLASGENVQMPGWFWLQGESDMANGSWTTQFMALVAAADIAIRGSLPNQADKVVCFTYQMDRAAAAMRFVNAQAQSPLIRIVAPMYAIQINGQAGVQFDQTHRSAPGYRHYGALCAVAWFCHVILKRPWRPLQLSYTARGNLRCKVDGSDLLLYWDVPHDGQLAFSQGNWIGKWPQPQNGIYLFNSSGVEKVLNGIQIEGRNVVRCVGAVPVAGDIVRIGYKDPTNINPATVLTNLRDCQGDKITFDDGAKIPLHNWALGEERQLTSGDLA